MKMGGRSLHDFLARADEEIRKGWPELDNDRDRVRRALVLPQVDDALLRSLHAAAAIVNYRPVNERGERYRPMLAWLEDAEEAEHPATQTYPEISVHPATRHDEPKPGQLGLF
jgi:hypothetical protein